MCVQLWYEKHLNAPARASCGPVSVTQAHCTVPRTSERTWPALNQEGVLRFPRAGVTFGDVDLTWHANQWDFSLVSSLGQLRDHMALSVQDLDAGIAKLRGEGVTFPSDVTALGGARAVMIEGPSREGLELVEVG